MNKISKASLFEAIAIFVIFAFPVIHETGYSVRIIRSPGILITPGILFILSGLLPSDKICRFRERCQALNLFFSIWAGVGGLMLLIPGFNKEIAFSTLFVIPAILIFISHSCRLIHSQTLRHLNAWISFFFIIILVNMTGLKTFRHMDFTGLLRIFTDQYSTSLFFLFLYLFIPSLLIIMGRGYINSSDTRPFKDYLRLFIPFQILFYMLHTSLIVRETTLSRPSLILHLQVILLLFLFFQILNGIFNTGKSYKKPVEIEIQNKWFGPCDRFDSYLIGTGMVFLAAGFFLTSPALYKSFILTALSFFGVYWYCLKVRNKEKGL